MAFNILLVDDSATVRAVIRKTLHLAEIPVNELHEAANGKEGLDVLSGHWIDLAFVDINMPVMNGVEMVEKMSEDGLLETIPVVLVSVEGSTTLIDRLKAKGVSAYIRKPFTPELIRKVFDEVLGPRAHADEREILNDAFTQVLEKFAFMFSESAAKEDLPKSDTGHLQAEMSFSGQISGSLGLAVPKEICREISANVLGLDPGDALAIEDAEDALKELLNVTCGQVLSAIAGEKAVFDLSVPVTKELDPSEWKALLDEPSTLPFLVEDKPMLLRLKLRELQE